VKDGTVMPAISSQPVAPLNPCLTSLSPLYHVIKLNVDIKRQSSHALTTVNVEQVASVDILTGQGLTLTFCFICPAGRVVYQIHWP
jgi:hypothetical protein